MSFVLNALMFSKLLASRKVDLPRMLFAAVVLFIWHGCQILGGPPQAFGQDADATEFRAVNFGFSGDVRLGHWNPISVTFADEGSAANVRRLELTCPDGDGVPVTYQIDPVLQAESPRTLQGWFRIGRLRGNLRIAAFDATDKLLASYETSVGTSMNEWPLTIHPSTSRILLAIAAPGSKLPRLIGNTPIQSLVPNVVPAPTPIELLPNSWLGYDGVHTIFLSIGSPEFIDQLGDVRLQAVMEWVSHGGHIVVFASANAASVFAANGKLSSWFPDAQVATEQPKSLARLESYINSPTPLLASANTKATILDVQSKSSVMVVTQDNTVIIQRNAIGFGLVTLVGLPLDQEPLLSWQATPVLCDTLTNVSINSRDRIATQTNTNSGNDVADICNQLRVPLERFSAVSFIPFTAVAVAIGLFLLLIGPGDYWFLRQFGRQMHWTWFTFPLIAAGFAGFAYWLYGTAKPQTRFINQLEIVDFDSVGKHVEGHTWNCFYSPKSSQVDFGLNILAQDLVTTHFQSLSWMGQPGIGLSGMQSTTPVLTIVNDYQSTIHIEPSATTNSGKSHIDLNSFPSAVASARNLQSFWFGTTELSVRSRLKVRREGDRIDGDITNPFEFPLKQPRLFFRNSVYVVERDLAPGDTMDLFTDASEQTVKRYFTRRTQGEGNTSSAVAWDPADTDLRRIAEMMMFHEMSGGSGYTGLTNAYANEIEFSNQLSSNQAILVAKVDKRFTELTAAGNSTSSEYDESMTMIRILLPVTIVD